MFSSGTIRYYLCAILLELFSLNDIIHLSYFDHTFLIIYRYKYKHIRSCFMKMPINIWKQMVKLQRQFIWGGTNRQRKILWVSWANVCKSKADGGLGIKDLRAVNLALLGKWR
jgi:hypothetical protein